MDAIEIIEQLQQNGYRAKVSVVIEMIPEDVSPPTPPPPVPPPPTPPPPPPEEPTRFVYITSGIANARFQIGENKADPPRPIMGIYPSDSRDDQNKRVQFRQGTAVLIYSKRIDADSTEDFYMIHPSQYDAESVKVPLYLRESDI